MQNNNKTFEGLLIATKIIFKRLIGRLKVRRANVEQELQKHEYRVISQHREDGIIDHLLGEVGVTNGTFVEFGFAIAECNCMNLVLNKDFGGLFIDGSKRVCTDAKSALSWLNKPKVSVVNSFLSTENINQIVTEKGPTGEIDVLSVDIDGNDYWLWSAIEVVNPRIVVAEYNASFGDQRAITIPYDPEFVRYERHSSGFYHGASLAALQKLGTQKGYQLVGCDFTGVNAFFVRNDLMTVGLKTISVADAFMENRGRVKYKKISTEDQYEKIADQSFVEISDGAKAP
jgi:hypothetical protein